MRRLLLLSALLLGAATAHAGRIPAFETNWVTMKVGEQRTIEVHTVWTGITDYGYVPMSFASDDPSIATASGALPAPGSGNIIIEAKQPGVTAVIATNGFPSGPLVYIVVGEQPPPRIAATALSTTPGKPVLLTVLYPHPEWATVRWFAGTTELGEGPDLTVVPDEIGIHRYTATVWTLWGTSSAAIDIEVEIPRRRSVRH